MKLALVTHFERPRLRGTLPSLWPEFMAHDNVVQKFWPQLYDLYPDFQLWVLDREATTRKAIGYACSVPVQWNGNPSARGLDWALTDGVEGQPNALCAVVAGLLPEYRGRGIAEAILRRLGAVAAGHGLEALVAPARPTWKERYPLIPIQLYARWRRPDGLPYDPWLRTHERIGGEILASAPRSMTVVARRPQWEEWTGMNFPEDGDYVVPGALVPVHFKNGRGLYVEPNVWVRHAI
jgi:GNAT superfamily N-acetyltransferase